MVSLAGYTATSPRAMQPSKRPSLPSRLPSHLFQNFVYNAAVNELVQVRQRLSLRPAELRGSAGFEKVLDELRRHFGAVFVVHLIVDALYDFGILDFKILLNNFYGSLLV